MTMTRWMVAGGIAVLAAAMVIGTIAARQARRPPRLQDLPPEAFQRVVVDLLRERFPTRTFVPGSDPYVITMDGDVQLGLTNVRSIVDGLNGSEEDERRAVLDFFSMSIANADAVLKRQEIPDTWHEVEPRIRPQLVGAAFYDQQAVKSGLVARLLAGDVHLAYVVDRPDAMAFVRQDDVTRWRVTMEALHAAAVQNLDKAVAPLDVRRGDGANVRGAFTFLVTDDGYAAARLVTPRFRAMLAKGLGDGYRVMTPTRNSLVAWSHDYSEVAGLTARAIDDARKNAYPISERVLTAVGDELRPLP